MAKKTVGELIREARTAAGLTQEQLAKKVDGASAGDISKAERGEKELTQAQLKQIAKATGVTQKSLLEAASGAKKTAAKKTAPAAKTTPAKKTTAAKKTTTTKKTAAKTELTAAEKRFLELYRAASGDVRKAAEAVLKGADAAADVQEKNDIGNVLSGIAKELLSGMK